MCVFVCVYIYLLTNFLKTLFTCLTERKREHKKGGQQAEGEGEADSPPSQKPAMGLHPRTPGSRPEPKADAQLTEAPRRPLQYCFKAALQGHLAGSVKRACRLLISGS